MEVVPRVWAVMLVSTHVRNSSRDAQEVRPAESLSTSDFTPRDKPCLGHCIYFVKCIHLQPAHEPVLRHISCLESLQSTWDHKASAQLSRSQGRQKASLAFLKGNGAPQDSKGWRKQNCIGQTYSCSSWGPVGGRAHHSPAWMHPPGRDRAGAAWHCPSRLDWGP